MNLNMRTKKYYGVALCLAIYVLVCLRPNEGTGQPAKSRSPFDDSWTEIFREATGDDFPTIDADRVLATLPSEGGPSKEWKPHVWKFTKDTLEEGRGTKESKIVKYSYELDAGGKASAIDMIVVEKDAAKEKRKLGIYWHAEDFLMIAWNPPGEPRPESLVTQRKSKTTMVILRRGILK